MPLYPFVILISSFLKTALFENVGRLAKQGFQIQCSSGRRRWNECPDKLRFAFLIFSSTPELGVAPT